MVIEPDFVEEVRMKYRTRQSNVFLLSGNVKDLFVGHDDSFLDLSSYLERQVVNNPNRVKYPAITVRYGLADGIVFPSSAEEEEVRHHFSGVTKLDEYLGEDQHNPLLALKMLREILAGRFNRLNQEGESYYARYSLIIEGVEMIIPQAAVNYLHQGDRENLAFLLNWLEGSELRSSANVVFMLSESLSEVNNKLVSLPSVTPLVVSRPSREEREGFIVLLLKEKSKERLLDSMGLDRFASLSAGLRLREIQKMVQESEGGDTPITPEVVLERSKELIEQECAGLIEFILPHHTLADVVGQRRLVEHLDLLRRDIVEGRKTSIPSGILVPGPNGSGKTFIFEAFAASCGWLALKFKNLRGSLVGETERNFEKVRGVLEALGHVVILVDEGDTELGGRGEFTHDVDRRLFAGLIRMMADSKNLGRLLFIIITCRPDKLEPDVKAPHRCSERLPVFDPGSKEEREEFLKWVLQNLGIDSGSFSEVTLASITEKTKSFSAADYQNLTRLIVRALEQGGEDDISRTVTEVIDDYLPPAINPERRLQELLAFLECSSRKLLPGRFTNLKRDVALNEVEEIKGVINR